MQHLTHWQMDAILVKDAWRANVQGTRANVARVCVMIGMTIACVTRMFMGR